jgi:hypothetical protein
MVMPGDPKQCREHAKKCADMASKATNPQHKQLLTNLAQSWTKIALELERSLALMDAYPPPRAGDGASPERPTK